MKKLKLSLLLVAVGMLALVACKDKEKETWRIPTAYEVIGRWEAKEIIDIEGKISSLEIGITGKECYQAYVRDGEWVKDTEINWGGQYGSSSLSVPPVSTKKQQTNKIQIPIPIPPA